MDKKTNQKIIRQRVVESRKRNQLAADTLEIADKENNTKTLRMVLIELKFGQSIEQLIWTGSIKELSAKLGVSCDTISTWRRKFPLREYHYGKNNRKLPVSITNGH